MPMPRTTPIQTPSPAPATPGATSSPRRRQTTQARQREIVATVLLLARERGPDAITTQAIADRMGVTQGAVFRHFPDKEAIWLAVFAWVRDALGEALSEAIGESDAPIRQIEHVFHAHVAFIAANPGVPHVMFHELQYPGDSPVRHYVRDMVSNYRQRVVELFAQARACGELPADLDPTLAAALVLGAVQGLVIQASLAGEVSAMRGRARNLWPLLLDGYRGRRSA